MLAPAKTMADMHKIVFNDRIDAALAVLFVGLVLAIAAFGIMACVKAYRADRWTALESGGPAAVPAE